MSLRVVGIVVFVYGGLIALTVWQYQRLPTGFIPAARQGLFSRERAVARFGLGGADARTSCRKSRTIATETDGIKNVNAVAGNSFVLSAYGSNFGSVFIILKGFDYRRNDPEMSGDALLGQIEGEVCQGNSGGPGTHLSRAGGIRARPRRRLQTDDRGSRRSRHAHVAGRHRFDRRARQQAAGLEHAQLGVQNELAAILPGHRPQKVHEAGSQSRRSVFRCCRAISVRVTRTISTASAGPGRSSSRPMPCFATKRKTFCG